MGEEGQPEEPDAATLATKLAVVRDALTREIQKVWAAERRVYDMGKKLAKAQERLRATQRELDAQRARAEAAEMYAAEMEDLAVQQPPTELTDKLTAVFREAEEALVRIVEEARTTAPQESPEDLAERLQMEGELARLAAWRGRIEPTIEALRASLAEAQREIEHVGPRIRDALDPLHGALAVVDTHLNALAAAGEDGIVDISEEPAPAGP